MLTRAGEESVEMAPRLLPAITATLLSVTIAVRLQASVPPESDTSQPHVPTAAGIRCHVVNISCRHDLENRNLHEPDDLEQVKTIGPCEVVSRTRKCRNPVDLWQAHPVKDNNACQRDLEHGKFQRRNDLEQESHGRM